MAIIQLNHWTGWVVLSLRVTAEVLLETDSWYPKDAGITTPWQTLGIPFAITPLDYLTSLRPRKLKRTG